VITRLIPEARLESILPFYFLNDVFCFGKRGLIFSLFISKSIPPTVVKVKMCVYDKINIFGLVSQLLKGRDEPGFSLNRENISRFQI
jgi:hypothetical protein